jgi:hypothetical protein
MRDHDDRFVEGLARFEREFETKAADPDWHPSEESVRECLANGLRAGLDLPSRSISFERASGRGRIDLWIEMERLAVEVKFHRPIPSGYNRPMTQQFGALLADCRKLAAADAADRFLVLVSDRTGATHIANKAMLPLSPSAQPRVIAAADLSALPETARRFAMQGGSWITLSVQLVWRGVGGPWSFLAWRIEPIERHPAPPSVTSQAL